MAEQKKDNHSLHMFEEHGEKENEERWLLTYADMITLLVAFFIMMYAMSVLNLEKFKELAFSIRSGFMGDMEGRKGQDVINKNESLNIKDSLIMIENMNNNNSLAVKSANENLSKNTLMVLKEQLNEIIFKKKLQGIVEIKEQEGNIYIIILTDKIFFKLGESELTEEAKIILKNIGEILKPLNNEITIEGYTSENIPNTKLFKNNWYLSAARAISVINFFENEIKIEPKRMSLTGYGEWRPFTMNPEDNKNDRVVIAILKKSIKK